MSTHQSKTLKLRKHNIPSTIIFAVIALFCVLPIFYVISISLTPEKNLAMEGYKLIPSALTLDNYKFILQNPTQILKAYGVSITVTAVGTVMNLFCTSTLAYVMARKDFKLSKIFTVMVLFTLLFNVGMTPSYITVATIYKLKDTLWALILPYVILPWYVFLMRSFLKDLPVSLIEAAQIDGASEFRIFFKIIMPILSPALATIGLLVAFTYWNDWWLGLLYIDNPDLTPLQYMLYRIMNNVQYLATNTGSTGVALDMSKLPTESARMVVCVLATLPMLCLFPFFQKYFVKGLTVGSVKG